MPLQPGRACSPRRRRASPKRRREGGATPACCSTGLFYRQSIRADLEHPGQSRRISRLMRLRLSALPRTGAWSRRVRLSALKRAGGHQRPRNSADGVSLPAIALKHWDERPADRRGSGDRGLDPECRNRPHRDERGCRGQARRSAIFNQALVEAADVSHAKNVWLDWILSCLSAGNEALWFLARVHH